MTDSRAKGARGEREWAMWLTTHGYPARRGVQYAGGPDSPDVICPALPIHWEVKRTEVLRLWPALEQALAEAAPGETAIVAHRPNGRPWIVVLRAEDFLALLRRQANG